MTTRTETEGTIDLGEIGVARRRAIHATDDKYRPLIEDSGKALNKAYADLGYLVVMTPNVVEALSGHVEFRRLLDKIEERLRDDAENYVGLQGEHQEIEDRFNKLTVEFFAKNPHPIITTVEQRIEAERANETPKGKINANR